MMKCEHFFNTAAIAAVRKSKRPEKGKVQCAKCGETFTLAEISDYIDKDECQTTETPEIADPEV